MTHSIPTLDSIPTLEQPERLLSLSSPDPVRSFPTSEVFS